MKKIVAIFTLSILVLSSLFQIQPASVEASTTKIVINGTELKTDQPPVQRSNRTMVPLRAIFEALDARVSWNQRTMTVGATKDGTSISLTIGSSVARVNNQSVALDVSAMTINNRTMVPIRFVSEALGANVRWDAATQTVFVTSNTELRSASNVRVKDISDHGDGRDLEVTFNRSADEANVDHYRVLVVKSSNARNFNLSRAEELSYRNYTVVNKTGQNQTVKLTDQTRDVDGNLIRNNESYVVYVLTAGNQRVSNRNVLSGASQAIVLTENMTSSNAATNVRALDVSDHGDGRDLEVTFTKARQDTGIANYRIMVVKTSKANNFNLSSANNVNSANYTVVSKQGSSSSSTTIRSLLNSNTRDTDGDFIRNGVSYTVFVLSVANNSNSSNNRLSSASSTITLSSNSPIQAPTNIRAEDAGDYNDGRDLRVLFNRSSDESKVANYRIFVVREIDANSFNLNTANNLANSNNTRNRYVDVPKTGYDITTTLPSSARDTRGDLISNNVPYRVFVMAVGNNQANYTNALSSTSAYISLSTNQRVEAVTNATTDVASVYGDGRDLRVTIAKPINQSGINQYRVFVAKSNSSFSLEDARNNANYLTISTSTSTNQNSVNFNENSTDTSGETLKSGVTYRIYVLSVSSSNTNTTNALFRSSSIFSLTATPVDAVSINNSDIVPSCEQGGCSITVEFTEPENKSGIGQYRAFVVPENINFTLGMANARSSFFTQIPVVQSSGSPSSPATLSIKSDYNGGTNNGGYRIYILSVSSNSNSLNSLSSPSRTFMLSFDQPTSGEND
ncbi:copper amine oxidase N-terminal domain-containing protein [Bacillus horti]|uniref:RNA-binding protein with TRAM domain n=1 Tax=Caldalkalibacillus horti TaxID=77523 RepID=A0ABT9VW54_9BACI|nr:copper amine oxidase N-terminal domain-containing protein [Bacillus horti]MDQ0165233.1 putative RNA-binding protein with TRAM domain [Bacillus horti]